MLLKSTLVREIQNLRNIASDPLFATYVYEVLQAVLTKHTLNTI